LFSLALTIGVVVDLLYALSYIFQYTIGRLDEVQPSWPPTYTYSYKRTLHTFRKVRDDAVGETSYRKETISRVTMEYRKSVPVPIRDPWHYLRITLCTHFDGLSWLPGTWCSLCGTDDIEIAEECMMSDFELLEYVNSEEIYHELQSRAERYAAYLNSGRASVTKPDVVADTQADVEAGGGAKPATQEVIARQPTVTMTDMSTSL